MQSTNTIDEFKNYLNVDVKNYVISPPIIEDFIIVNEAKNYDVVYVEKIAEGWGVFEFLDFLNNNPKIKGVIVYSRILYNFDDNATLFKIEKYLQSLENLTIYKDVNRTEVLHILAQSKISYCFRCETIDNDNSFEISTKLLETMNLEIPIIIRTSKLDKDILGENYPLLVDNEADLEQKILYAIKNHKNMPSLNEKSLNYVSGNIYNKNLATITKLGE